MPKKPIRQPFYSQEHESWAIPLTQGVIALIDADMVPILGEHNWYANLCCGAWLAKRNGRGHDRRTHLMHREIMSPPDGLMVDHRVHYDSDIKVIDNRRANLRICSASENGKNKRPSGGSSQWKGVQWDGLRKKWKAQITVNFKTEYLGYYTDEIAAAKAYDSAAISLFGEFALLNFSGSDMED